MVKRCQHVDCKTRPTFGLIGSKISKYCEKHKPHSGYENVTGKRCKYLDCKTIPSFALQGTSKNAEYCAKHRPPEYVNVIDKKCKYPDCNTIPIFGPIGGARKDAEYCTEHKPTFGYVDVKNKRCKHIDCNIQPTFGPIGGSKKDAEYCAKHVPVSGYTDVKHIKCNYLDCNKRPTFGRLGGIAQYCAIHKPPEYINVVDKICQYPDCNTQPTFGPIGSYIAEFCAKHKPDFGYENVKSKKCQYLDCKKQPVFGPIGGSRKDVEFCATHKPLTGYIDLSNKRCIYEGCKKYPTYGFLGRTISHCTHHKEPSMILNPLKRCHECKKIATYTKDKLFYCDICNNNALDSIEIGNTCLCCRITSIADNTDKNTIYCTNCTEKIKTGGISFSVRTKEKENRIFKLITKENNYFAIQDSTIEEGCSKRRPDIRLFANWGSLIIEVDENQHRNYTNSCNYSRLNDIYVDNDSEKMVVIRYNPDNYKPSPDYKLASQAERETTLLKYINEFMTKEATQILSGINILHLYYDFFNPNKQDLLLFDPYKYAKHMAENNDDSTFKLE